MNETMAFLISGIAGALLGLVFFWGLWRTVHHLGELRHPALWLLGSMFIRFAVVLAGFLLLARYGGWQHLLVAVAGFTLIRLVMVRRVRSGQTGEEPGT